ncbi:DNA glycosylase, partial [Bombardia bombarda]
RLLDPDFRKQIKRGKDNPSGLTPGYTPYLYREAPTPEACEEIYRILAEIDGDVKQPDKMPAASLEVAGCGEVPCVLDALLRTLVSSNTLMGLADVAIKNLGRHYGTRRDGTGAGSINWEKVRLSSHEELTQAIKITSCGPTKAKNIKRILDIVHEECPELYREKSTATTGSAEKEAESGYQTASMPENASISSPYILSLDHMRGMSKDEAMAKFVRFPGIGIKTAACVTLFCLRIPCFAVDTHVHRFCRWLGWIPEKADADNCFRHGDAKVPDHLKYGLHQLFICHGQRCFKCQKATKSGTMDWDEAPDRPLEHLLDRTK